MKQLDIILKYIGTFFLSIYGYILILTVFGVWILFFDSNSIIREWQIKTENKQIEREIERYKKSIEDSEKKIKSMSDDREALEKYARERYGMQSPDEDVLLFDE